jgi:DtxR family Mn-dependent transcriptional regulator
VTTIEWLRKRLLPGMPRGWADECPTGLPVPEAHRCAAVDCESVPLTSLAEGERGCITCLQDPGATSAAKVAALGALPGVELELVQRFPAFVFRIGYAEVAVDTQLAESIRVRRILRPRGRFK